MGVKIAIKLVAIFIKSEAGIFTLALLLANHRAHFKNRHIHGDD